MVSNSQTYGVLLLGGLIAIFLSGIVATQVYMYHRNYPRDRMRNKSMVVVVWLLDLIHSSFVCASVFHYVISGLNDITAIQRIAWTVSATISLTGVLTFLVHCFFTVRVWTLSRQNKWLCWTIMSLAFLRMLSAFGTVAEMRHYQTWKAFHLGAAWIFTAGLAVSASVDLLIAMSLLWFLKKSRTGFSSMDQIIDMIMVYTVENGLLTTMCTIGSFVCWLTMPENFIFLAIHFGISKLYANSLLATLNARSSIRERSISSNEHRNNFPLASLLSRSSRRRQRDDEGQQTIMSVEGAVDYVTDAVSIDGDIEVMEPAYMKKRSSYVGLQAPSSTIDANARRDSSVLGGIM